MGFARKVIDAFRNMRFNIIISCHYRHKYPLDYGGVRSVVELKIWHGEEYHARGEKQLLEYLEYYHLEKGYLISFNFNKKKEVGVKNIQLGNKMIVEAVV